MKRILCLLLALAMLVILSACGLNKLREIELPPLPDLNAHEEKPAATDRPLVIETPLPNVLPTITPTEAPVQESLPAQEGRMPTSGQVLINFLHTAYENFDPEEGTQRILTFAYDTPVLVMEDRPASAEEINRQIALLDEAFYMGDENLEGSFGYNGMLEMAEDNYAYMRQSGEAGAVTEYSTSRTVSSARVDDRMINLLFTYHDYTGGAHGNYAQEAYVFDSYNGERLQLEDLTSDYPALRDCIIHYMIALTETDSDLYEHIYLDWIPNNDFYAAFAKLLRQGSWYFDDRGLIVFSSLYELGPYAAGTARFGIPYGELKGKIEDKWLPENRTESGSIQIMGKTDAENGRYAFVDRVELSADGEEFCVTVDGTAYDVKLSSVSYVDRFYEKDELWFASKLQNAAVQVIADVPEALPSLMLSYSDDAGQKHSYVISRNGKSGGVQLVADTALQSFG